MTGEKKDAPAYDDWAPASNWNSKEDAKRPLLIRPRKGE